MSRSDTAPPAADLDAIEEERHAEALVHAERVLDHARSRHVEAVLMPSEAEALIAELRRLRAGEAGLREAVSSMLTLLGAIHEGRALQRVYHEIGVGDIYEARGTHAAEAALLERLRSALAQPAAAGQAREAAQGERGRLCTMPGCSRPAWGDFARCFQCASAAAHPPEPTAAPTGEGAPCPGCGVMLKSPPAWIAHTYKGRGQCPECGAEVSVPASPTGR